MTDAEIEARAYQTTLDEALAQQRMATQLGIQPGQNTVDEAMKQAAFIKRLQQSIETAQPPRQLIDTWSAHQADKARIAQLEAELAAMTKEMAYANLRMTVCIADNNLLRDELVRIRITEAERVKAAAGPALNVPDPSSKGTFPARALTPQRGDGWIMVR
jgi:hypothetical protein